MYYKHHPRNFLSRNITPKDERSVTAIIFSGACLFCVSNLTFAAPSISSAEIGGSAKQGTTVTIAGSGFGSTSPANNMLWDTVDNQDAYNDLSSGSSVPTDSGIWTQNGSQWANPLTIQRSGDLRTDNSNAVYRGEKKSYIGWPRTFDGLTNKTIYVTWWFKPQGDMYGDSSSNKVIRIWDDYGGESTRISWTHHHLTYDAYDMGITGTADWSNIGTNSGQWSRLEIWADGNNGNIVAKTDGKTIHNITDFKKSSISDGLTVGLIGFDPSIANNYSNFSFLMDDIYASTTQARVELSSASNWADTNGKREIQPVTSWSNGKISFTLNLGSLSPSSSLYLYVVDSSGQANSNGYSLSNAGDLGSPPSAPINPTVE